MVATLNDNRLGILLGVLSLTACDSRLVIATVASSSTPVSCNDTSDAGISDAAVGDGKTSFVFPWATGFEDGFCDYADPGGFCYTAANATYDIVTAPVHSGHSAAAFGVVADASLLQIAQARCVRQGPLPAAAFYGAWYYVPSANKNAAFWNLLHFRGGSPTNGTSTDDSLHGLWDVSLVNDSKGGLRLSVRDFLRSEEPSLTNPPPIPIGAWFHIEVYLKRASDASGEFAVYQDGIPVLQLTNLATDDSDWGRWYVGNLALALDPPDSTLYVDDLSISASH